jgi:Zn-dependent protease with chaperone function
MINRTARTWALALGFAALMAVASNTAVAQTKFKPGFNLFSPAQDQEIGAQSAKAAEQQLPILKDKSTADYVGRIGKRLAAVAPGADYPYQFKVVNASDINAFALPGGYMYVNRGLIEAAQNEGQLAGVMAHEMAHIALRHGTSQASKAYLSQTGLGILGGLVGKGNASTEQAISSIGGFGLNTVFLKFSRTAEEQADITGAQMLAAAGYDPVDMVKFFNILASEQKRSPGKVEQFFSSHPAPANRAARINQEIALLTVKPVKPVGGFAQVKSNLTRMRPAASMQQIAQGQSAPAAPSSSNQSIPEIRVAGPSTEFNVFTQRDDLFEISYPDNWDTYEAEQGYGVIIAPEGGYVDVGGEERDLISGVIVNHYKPIENDSRDRFSAGLVEDNASLADATNDLLAIILRTNSDMRVIKDSQRRSSIDGAPSLSVVLAGKSPVTQQEERITLFTREVDDEHIIYALFIAAAQDYKRLNETFNRMITSLQVDTGSTHASNTR